jgi:hypothetical protein
LFFILLSVQRYLGLSACYGFYRGWNADYDYRKYNRDKPIKPIGYNLQTEKYCIKFLRGIVNASSYGTFGNIFAVYNLICRVEIKLLNMNPYDHMDVYAEIFNSTTLAPRTTT